MSLRPFGRRAAALVGVTMRKLERLAAAAAIGLAAFGAADQASAGVTFTGQFGDGGTWNVYEAIETPFTFKQAWEFAMTRPDPTGGSEMGHLVTLASLEENNFVHTTGGGGDRWIGLSDRVGVAPGATESAFGFDPATEGWAWVTGEPFTFQNWGDGEPNNAAPGEDAAHLRADSLWNDNASGFGADDPEPDPDPIFGDSPAEGAATFGFIIEWSTNLATEPPGFPMIRDDPLPPRVFPAPLTRLPGPDGTASAFGVLDIRDVGTGGVGGMRAAVTEILSGMGTRIEGTATHFDIHDPDNGAAQGSIAGPQVPIPSNMAGVDDDNFQEVVKGTFIVPAGQGGNYTFNVRSDDGFAMRILSQPSGGSLTQHQFTASSGGITDEDGTLVFMAPTGDSNTQGVINLAPGTYDVEFAWFEDGGGAFAEVSTAKGDFVSTGGFPQWVLLGSNESRTQVGPFSQAARLTEPADVLNYSGAPGNIATSISNFRTNPTGATSQGTADTIALTDPDDICCGRPSIGLPAEDSGLPSHREDFPNVGVLNPHDNFTTAVTGTFEVLDTNGASGETLTFGILSDDYTGLHIIGEDFTGVSDFDAPNPDANTATLGTPTGEQDTWVLADYFTGNTNAFGLITLTEGVYDFEAFHGEGGGDSGLEIWVAAGNHLATGFNGAAFFPLTTATLDPRILPANQGLALVDGPGMGPSETTGPDGDYNADGIVDAADYVMWRKDPASFGGQAGYDLWVMNFGNTAGGSGVGSAAVPEPASALLVVVGLAGGGLLLRRRSG